MDKTTVLIVEDEAIVAADLAGKLERLGYELAGIAASGEDAVEAACSKRPHVVLMDIWLKGPMDGIEAAETIRRRMDVPVIYLTAHSDTATLDRAKLSGPFGFILKPFEERELATTIEMALYKHQSDRRLREQQEALRRSHDELERRVEERTRELRQANAYNRSLIEAGIDPLVTIGHDGKITDVNAATETATGRARSELIGTDFCDFFSEPDKARAGYEQAFREGSVRDYPLELCHRDGRITAVLYNASVYRDQEGEVIGVFAAARDVTELKRAEAALMALNDTLEEQVLERTAQLKSANDTLRASRVAALNLMEDAVAARRGAEEANEELRRENVERKRVEEELRRAKEAAEAASLTKSQFLANMSHELRTPLTGLLGMLEIARGGPLDERQREAIDTAHASGQSLLMIINDILDLTRIETGRFLMEEKPFILRKSVTDSVNFLKPEALRKGLGLDWMVADDVPETVIGDRLRLQQVLTNLLGNAVKFTEKGRIAMTVTAGKKIRGGKREFTFAVSDSGIGIADDKKEVIFEPFSQADLSHTRRYGGTGLGLTISRQIVELMGGSITLESTEGKGSTFTFTVPFQEADAEKRDMQVEAAPPERVVPFAANGARTRLLVAEDDEVTRKVLDFMFRQYDFDLQFALNGREALDLWEKGSFDLIIMDGQMPEMDGFTATRAIRERELETGSRIPIIAITAHAFPEDEQRCLDAGMDAYIAKPIEFRKCIAMIRTMLEAGDAKG